MDGQPDDKLGAHIEGIRRQLGLTLDEVAERSGVSRATLSRIERAQTSPTAQVLGRLCPVFGLTVSQLLAAVEIEQPSLVRGDQLSRWVDPDTGFRRSMLSPPTPGYSVEISHGEMPPGKPISYQQAPIAGLEHHIVGLNGRLKVTLGGTAFILGKGDCLRFKLAGQSSFEALDERPATYLIIVRRPG